MDKTVRLPLQQQQSLLFKLPGGLRNIIYGFCCTISTPSSSVAKCSAFSTLSHTPAVKCATNSPASTKR